ncbi:cell division protein FtsL [Massilibacterium senegalense]|uniref:cell division protein FtsL n=1 Tax=Massilibacterium senegalense TaxID=1632858 RepID=UPI000782DCEA|nr:cell division protein FtsL [Massilibacterium senegalense]
MGNLAVKVREQQEHPRKRKRRIIVKKTEQPAKQIHTEGKRTLGEKILWLSLLSVVTVMTLFLVHNVTQMYALNRDIHTLRAEVDGQNKTVDQLKVEVSQLSQPERIITIATEQLGMVLNNEKVKVVEKESKK